jgi:hypothetical protein
VEVQTARANQVYFTENFGRDAAANNESARHSKRLENRVRYAFHYLHSSNGVDWAFICSIYWFSKTINYNLFPFFISLPFYLMMFCLYVFVGQVRSDGVMKPPCSKFCVVPFSVEFDGFHRFNLSPSPTHR